MDAIVLGKVLGLRMGRLVEMASGGMKVCWSMTISACYRTPSGAGQSVLHMKSDSPSATALAGIASLRAIDEVVAAAIAI